MLFLHILKILDHFVPPKDKISFILLNAFKPDDFITYADSARPSGPCVLKQFKTYAVLAYIEIPDHFVPPKARYVSLC